MVDIQLLLADAKDRLVRFRRELDGSSAWGLTLDARHTISFPFFVFLLTGSSSFMFVSPAMYFSSNQYRYGASSPGFITTFTVMVTFVI